MASLPWLAASVPVSIVTGVLGGALQAREAFGLFNLINVGNVLLSQLIPLGIAYWHGPELTWLIPAVLIARAIGAIPTAVALIRLLPLWVGGGFELSRLRSLFSYGGWITITNLLTPVLNTMDRMLIGSVLSAEAVAFYTVPFNLVSRASVLPGALATSLFPRFSRSSKEDSAQLASDAVAALASVMTPVFVAGLAVLPVFMQHWVGRSFAQQAAPVGIALLIGVWVNGLAYIPYGQLQASGRPDIVAKFHAVELIPFLAVLWLGLHYFGLVGAAWAWSLRCAVDSLLLFMVGGRIPRWHRLLPGGILVGAAAWFSPTAVLSSRTIVEIGLLAVAVLWSWNLSPAVRTAVRQRFGVTSGQAVV